MAVGARPPDIRLWLLHVMRSANGNRSAGSVPPVSETIEPRYGARYTRGLQMAAELHATQSRKGTQIPYVSHLLHVSALVWEGGGNEDAAIAALLHDAIEDQGRGGATRDAIAAEFGDVVVGIVEDCSDAESDVGAATAKAPWGARKEAHLAHLSDHSDQTLLVVLADKLHNATSMLGDLVGGGVSVEVFWKRFNAEPEGSIWYFHRIHGVLDQRGIGGPLLGRFDAVIDALSSRAGVDRATARPIAKKDR